MDNQTGDSPLESLTNPLQDLFGGGSIDGNGGNDYLLGGSMQEGNEGNDILEGQISATYIGGPGADTFKCSPGPGDTVEAVVFVVVVLCISGVV